MTRWKVASRKDQYSGCEITEGKASICFIESRILADQIVRDHNRADLYDSRAEAFEAMREALKSTNCLLDTWMQGKLNTVASLKARRNGNGARPNFRKPDVYSQATNETEAYLERLREIRAKAAGTYEDRPRIPWYRRIKVWHLALLTLGAIGLLVMALA